jgi:hypothetical protein
VVELKVLKSLFAKGFPAKFTTVMPGRDDENAVEMVEQKQHQEADDRHLLGDEPESDGHHVATPTRSNNASAGAAKAAGRGGWLVQAYRADPLLFLTILGVVVGILFGLILTATLPEEREAAIKLIGFPGRILLNVGHSLVVSIDYLTTCR